MEENWLQSEENESLNIQIYQLLASYQVENILLAFQFISGGGATPEVLSMIAALMRAHPDRQVMREAEKLLKQLGPKELYEYFKNSKIFFRRSGRSLKKLNVLFDENLPLEEIPFRIMHACIAAANPNIADIKAGEFAIKASKIEEAIPSWIQYFGQFKKISLEKCQSLPMRESLLALSHLPECTYLSLAQCKASIGTEIAAFKHLNYLDLSSNTVLEPDALKELKNLKHLKLSGCQIENWNFIKHLSQLEYLDISRNKLDTIPEPLVRHKKLRVLIARQNKITNFPKEMTRTSSLEELDLSGNVMEKMCYELLNIQTLQKLRLRSNKLRNWDFTKFRYGDHLLHLDLANNQLSDFPVLYKQLNSLNYLDLSKNQLHKLDKRLLKKEELQHLNVADNQIRSIPSTIAGQFFMALSFANNQIESLERHMAFVETFKMDLRNNRIKKVHRSVKRYDGAYYRRDWKLAGNPIKRLPK